MDMVGFCPFQLLLLAKAGVSLGDTVVDPTIVPHVEKMALTRVASFRQLQGPYLMFCVVGRGAGLPEKACIVRIPQHDLRDHQRQVEP